MQSLVRSDLEIGCQRTPVLGMAVDPACMLQGKEEDVELLLADLRPTRLTQSYISPVLLKHSLAG